jgi:hypothetical protein
MILVIAGLPGTPTGACCSICEQVAQLPAMADINAFADHHRHSQPSQDLVLVMQVEGVPPVL